MKRNTKSNGLGQRLREYRVGRHWTLSRMSALTGLAMATISRIENGKTVATPLTLRILADKLPNFEEKES